MPNSHQCNFILQVTFENLITSFLEDKVGLAENFLSEILAAELKKHLLSLYSDKQFQMAGIGNKKSLIKEKLIRNDLIYWLDRKHNNIHENSFFDLMDEFVKYLNLTCYTGITGYEFHYALYENGSFYKRHLDQFQSNKSRAFSMIMYLNEYWQTSDGGELCVYIANRSQIIAPTNGKCVFFKSSELEHEVLLNHKPRMSITGWLKTD